MKITHQNYIEENRLKMSMVDMAQVMDISYNKVRDYMIANNFMLTKEQVYKVKSIKKNNVNSKSKPWNWDAIL
jgi:phage antirepressor YoqD-like protein